MAVPQDGSSIITGSKDCSVIKWDAQTGKKIVHFEGGLKGATGFKVRPLDNDSVVMSLILDHFL